MEEQEVAHLPAEPEPGKQPCPPSPCQKYCHFPGKEPSPAQQLTRPRRWVAGTGRHTARKASLEITGLRGWNTTAFLYVLLWTKAFLPIVAVFLGGWGGGERGEHPPILSFPRDTSEGKKSGDNGSEGEDA